MVPLLLLLVGVGAATSLVPFVFPETIIALFGVVLNHWLGELVAGLFGSHAAFLEAGPTGLSLTFPGVLAVYAPILAVLTYLQAGR